MVACKLDLEEKQDPPPFYGVIGSRVHGQSPPKKYISAQLHEAGPQCNGMHSCLLTLG